MADRLSATHELHEVLYEELTSAGFSIPFPQREIHLHLDSNGKALVGRATVRNSVTDT
jgi:small-conductance mechanosensitive channel